MASSEDITNEEEVPPVVVAGNDTEESGESSRYNSTEGYTSEGMMQSLKNVLVLMASPLTDEQGSTKSVIAGLTTIVLAGTCVGLAAPANEILSPSYRRISAALGYIYFMAWSVSFYPQVISNFKRQSTVGLSPDFVVLNVIGFACYTAYNASLYWNSSIQTLYKERYGPDAEITVQSNDVAFAIHALVLSVLTLCQILYYHKRNAGANDSTNSTIRLSKPIVAVIHGIAIVCLGFLLLVVVETHTRGKDTHSDGQDYSSMGKFNWLDFLYLLSYIKIFISLIKYIPQVILNMKRKSTVGWSIWNILLDLTGGTLSDLQLVLDCADLKDFTGITHNKAKLALGSLSIVFDLIFLAQHYCLYSGTTAATNEQTEPLLPPSDTEEGRTEEGNDAASPEDSSQASSTAPRTVFV